MCLSRAGTNFQGHLLLRTPGRRQSAGRIVGVGHDAEGCKRYAEKTGVVENAGRWCVGAPLSVVGSAELIEGVAEDGLDGSQGLEGASR
jgi:hypothetical protein